MSRKPRTLTEYITRRKVSQSAVARELQISPQHLSEILSGRKTPSLAIAVRISKACGVPIESLLPCGQSTPSA